MTSNAGSGDATSGGRCAHCGSNLTLEDLSLPSCRYCGTIFSHVARAAEKVAVIHGLMGGALVAPRAGGPSPIVPGVVMPGAPASPPMTGGPVAAVNSMSDGSRPGFPPAGFPHAGYPAPVIHPYADTHQAAVASTRRIAFTIVAVVFAVTIFFTLLGLAAFFLLWQR